MKVPKGWDLTVKSCPFCGGQGRLWKKSFLGRWFESWIVRCEICGTKQGASWKPTEKEAVSTWQTRNVRVE